MTRASVVVVALLAFGSFLAPRSALADDVVFPKGVRVGLVPLPGLTPATAFPGFEATDQRVKVLLTELPKDAFAAIETTVKTEAAAAGKTEPAPPHPAIEAIELESGAKAFLTRETATDNGVTVRRFSLLVGGAGFSGYVAVQVPDAANGGYADEAIRKMLATTTLRANVPPEEQLDRLPFKLSETGGFKSMRSLTTGTTILLTDATEEEGLENAPYMLIGLLPDGPATPADRDRFAQEMARTLPGLRDARITSSEPMRIEGMPGYETRIDAVSGKAGTPVRIVQWLRFGNSTTTLRIVAGATRDDWQAAFTRFRAVRDGIAPR